MSAIQKTYQTTKERKPTEELSERIDTSKSLTNTAMISNQATGFKQPSDEDEQGNVLTTDELAPSRMDNSNCTQDKQDAKPSANKKNKRHQPHPNGTEDDS
jgi:hypothetical protein